jgi:hypothetical protein
MRQAQADVVRFDVVDTAVRHSGVGETAHGELAPSTVGVVRGIVSGIFRAAMRDKVIAHNPCDGSRLPNTTKSRVEPLARKLCLRWPMLCLTLSSAGDLGCRFGDAGG